MLLIHLIGENGKDCWPEQMLQLSTGAAEYLILYTGTWTRQANSSFILTFRPTLLDILNSEIIACERCPRLRQHSAEVAQLKRRAYRDQTYWGLPVPSFGDPAARVLILGLAPGAHGSNRTGRMFTGDRSGDILYKVLHKTGFASYPVSVSRDDGLKLHNLYITAAAHCAPPGNKPTPDELRNCRPYFERELELLPNLKVIVALGKIAFDVYLDTLKSRGIIASRAPFVFGHDVQYRTGAGQPVLIGSYHPSQQNTSTGKLNEKMLTDVFRRARNAAGLTARSRDRASGRPGSPPPQR
jgi:uracil-DNA glycosylase